MKTKTLNTLLLSLMITFVGCTTNDVTRNVENGMARMAGNKPPKFFHFTAPKYVDRWKFRHKDYEALSPLSKAKDWTKMGGWGGAYIGNSIAFSLRQNPRGSQGDSWIKYAFNISTSISNYTEWDRALEDEDMIFYKEKMPQRKDKYGRVKRINVHIEHHGKENYPCVVWEEKDNKRGIKIKTYSCHKFNPQKTKEKHIAIKLIYTQVPNLPTKYKNLAKEYTYQDLQKRAKRVLDSLYIRDGWSK